MNRFRCGSAYYFVGLFFCSGIISAQTTTCLDNASVPCITLKNALERAAKYANQVQTAGLAQALAREDRIQTRANLLPSLNVLNQFIYTEGNGTPSGVFVANDGVHIYNEQAVVHQDLFNFVRRADLRRAHAAEAVATARKDVATRGLNTTVVQDYYAIIVASRKLQSANTSLKDANEFLDITRRQEQRGEAARADTVKAQLQLAQRQRDMQDAQVAVEKAKVALAVLIFPDVTRDFIVEDDIEHAPGLQDLGIIQQQATVTSPDLRAASATVLQSHNETNVARYAYLPSLGVDFYYGIDANQFAANSSRAQDTGRSTLPNYLVENRQNLGYSAAVTLTIPVWNWGSIQSKVKQSRFREEQARLDLSYAQKQLRADVQSSYLEAQTAQQQLSSLRTSIDLAADSLRLVTLRYKAGESTVLEVVDAQTTLAMSRNAYADGLLRYRLAASAVQSLTGQLGK